jgi:hypothetical protein
MSPPADSVVERIRPDFDTVMEKTLVSEARLGSVCHYGGRLTCGYPISTRDQSVVSTPSMSGSRTSAVRRDAGRSSGVSARTDDARVGEAAFAVLGPTFALRSADPR